MKSILLVSLFFVACIQVSFAPPVPPEKQDESGLSNDLLDLEYKRYLEEVVNALESDSDFKQKLEKADELDIQSGKIAHELEFVSHHVRTRLDEIKRVELERLKEVVAKKNNLEKDINKEGTHGHLDHENAHTFEIEDLKKLIAKINEDLNKADELRREQFKKYELEKEYEKQKKLNETNGAEREKLEREFKEKEEKHKKHERVHQPIHKAQLEEVWEKQDQMQQKFDQKTFFMLHDLDGNGLWDQDEVKAILFKNIEKVYQPNAAEDDIVEAAEELERMRETVFQEVDINRDGFIDYMEFAGLTKKSDFEQDNGWKGLDEQKPYTDEELAQYISHHQMQQMQQGYPHQQVPPGYHNQPVYQQHPGQIPPLHVADLNTNEIHPGQHVQYQHSPNQPQYQQQVPPYQQPPYQQHQNQPQYQQHPNQPQYQQVHPNAQYQHQQVPNQGQAPPNVQQQNLQYQHQQPNQQLHQQGQPSQQQGQPSQPQSVSQESQQKPQSPQSQSQNPQSHNMDGAQQGSNAGAQQNQAFQQSQNNVQAGHEQPVQQNHPQVVSV